jgi:flagellar hook assembly protein FlgD
VAELNILVGVDTEASDTNSIEDARPTSFSLSQNYPNPFNMETTFRYEIPYTTEIRLDIYDILGHHIKTLVQTKGQAGPYTTSWDGKNDQGMPVVSGIYFCRLDAGGIGKTVKVQVVK